MPAAQLSRPSVAIFVLVTGMALGVASSPAHAAPLKTPASSADDSESPAAKSFRAGLQSLINKQAGEARKAFEASLKADPKYVPALLGMATLEQNAKRSKEAQQWLTRAEQAAPQSAEVHLAWGRFHMAQGRPSDAEQALLKAISFNPQALPARIELGDLYLSSAGRAADALKTFQAAVAIAPDNRFALYGLGASAALSGKVDDALQAFQRCTEVAPKDPAPWRAIGRLHLERGAADKGLAAFDAGLQRLPSFLPLMLDRVDALGAMQRWPEALQQIEQAAKTEPKSADVLLKKADVLQGMQRWAEAERAYLQTIERAPNQALAYNNLAWMTLVRGGGDANKAVAWARKAVSLSPRSSPFHDTLGWAERATGRLDAAATSLQKAIALEGNVAGYHLHLGTVRAEQNQKVAARTALERAIALDPQGDKGGTGAEARKRLLALGAG
jgi:cellulose synthase operon protein C